MKRLILTVVLLLSLVTTGAMAQQGVGQAQAISGQEQVQYQGQTAVSGGGSVGNSGNSAIGIKDSFNGAAPIRYLPIPSAIPMENYQATIFGSPNYGDKGPNFISMRQLVAAMNMADLSSDVKTKNITMNVQVMGKAKSKVAIKKVLFKLNDGEAVNHGFVPIAVISCIMRKTDDLNSASLAMALGQKAKGMGAGKVVFLTEGSSVKLESGGWGIGLSYNMAKVGSDSNDMGSVGAGGTGYSRGWGKHKNLVYLTAILGN